MHHGLSQRISAVAYKERLRDTYLGLETAFTTDEMIAILASLYPAQSQESLLVLSNKRKKSSQKRPAQTPPEFLLISLSSRRSSNQRTSTSAERSIITLALEVSIIAFHHTLPCSFTLSRTARWDLRIRKNKEEAYSNLIQSFWPNQPPVRVYRNFRGDFLKIVRIDNDFNRHNAS
jgi:hypothetical protein